MTRERGKSKEQSEPGVPEGYSAEEWAEYQADPVGFCIKELNSRDASVRYNAVDILRGCAGDAKAAIPALCELLFKDKDREVRAQCAFALREICERVEARAARQAVGPLAEALRDSYAEVRSLAANALGALGRPAKLAKPRLLEARKDRNAGVREAVEEALELLESV